MLEGPHAPSPALFAPIGPGILAQDALWRFRRRFPSAVETKAEQLLFAQARRAESRYAKVLRQVATQIGQFVTGQFDASNPDNPGWSHIEQVLLQHAMLIRNWAEAVARRMLTEIDRRDMAVWQKHGQKIGRALRAELASAPIGNAYNSLLQQQIEQIGNLSTTAAGRIARLHDRARQMTTTGERWESIVDDVMQQEHVSRSHANLIARTETARAQSTFTAVRAQHVGSQYFRWRTVGDADVRPLHRRIARDNGGVYRWDSPPTLDDGRPGLPGTIWNCRCFAEPILAEEEPVPQPIARSPEYLASLKPEAAPINELYRKGKLSIGEYYERLLKL